MKDEQQQGRIERLERLTSSKHPVVGSEYDDDNAPSAVR